MISSDDFEKKLNEAVCKLIKDSDTLDDSLLPNNRDELLFATTYVLEQLFRFDFQVKIVEGLNGKIESLENKLIGINKIINN